MTQDEFAKVLKVRRETIGGWESNEHYPRDKEFMLRDEFGLDIYAISLQPDKAEPPVTPRESGLVLGLRQAITELRAGADPEAVADLLELLMHGAQREA